jgi:hypothetical protein
VTSTAPDSSGTTARLLRLRALPARARGDEETHRARRTVSRRGGLRWVRGIDGDSGGYDVRLRYGTTVVLARHQFYSGRSAVLTSHH